MNSEGKINYTEFYNKFLTEMKSELPYFEKIRLELLNNLKKNHTIQLIIITLCVAGSIILAYMGGDFNNNKYNQIIMFLIIIMLTTIAQYFHDNYYYQKFYHQDIKGLLAPYLLMNIDDIHMSNREFPNFGEAKEFGIRTDSSVRNDDVFWGKYKNIRYQISEIHRETQSRMATITTYEGIICTFHFNKKIRSKIKITDKKFLFRPDNLLRYLALIIFLLIYFSICGFFTIKGKDGTHINYYLIIFILASILIIALRPVEFFVKLINKKKISLEDKKFTDYFKVISDDEIESRYILTPAFMERLMNLKRRFKAKTLECTFENDKMMIFMKTNRDLFEIGDLFKPLTDRNSLRNFYFELSEIIKIIDYFKLDEQTKL